MQEEFDGLAGGARSTDRGAEALAGTLETTRKEEKDHCPIR
jgi:hypothetical protein